MTLGTGTCHDTRMGKPTVKDAPGLEVIQTYNLIVDE